MKRPAFNVFAILKSLQKITHTFFLWEKLSKRQRGLLFAVTLAINIIGIPVFMYTIGQPQKASASWFDDNWLYRKAIEITAHTSAESNVYVSTTISNTNTLVTNGQLQSDCGDLRFTKKNGDILPYYIVSGCNSATTTVHIQFDAMPAGAQTIYFYYGNPSAPDGFSATDFQTAASGVTVGSTGSEEQAPSPVAYWKLDDGQGTSAKDSTSNANNGTFSGSPTWQTEDQCVAGKCVYFPGGSSGSVTVSNTVKNVKTISFWVRPATSSATLIDLNTNDASVVASSGTISAPNITSPTVYVNGVSGATTLTANQWQFVTVTTGTGITASTIKIGNVKGDFLKGFLDEVKLYNFTRSSAQILLDYSGRNNGKGASAVLGSSIQNQPAALANGLVGYWKMDESSYTGNCSASDLIDSSGNSNSGKACPNASGPSVAVGKFGNSTSFSGANYIAVTQSSSVNVSDDFSLAGWINTTTTNTGLTGATFISKDLGGCGAGVSDFFANVNSNKLVFWTSGSTCTAVTSNTSVNDGSWHHFVLTRERTTGKHSIYIDGVLDITATGNTGSVSNTTDLILGAISTSADFFPGKLDDVRVYNRVLSSADVTTLYNFAPGPIGEWSFESENKTGTTAYDTSGNANNATLTQDSGGSGTPTFTQGKFGTGLNFAGNGTLQDAYTATTYTNPDGLTIEIWVKTNSTRGGYIMGFGDSAGGGTSSSRDRMIYMDNSGILRFYIWDSVAGTSRVITSTGAYNDNTWHFLSATWSSSAGSALYVDGKLEVSDSSFTSGQSYTGRWRFGRDSLFFFPGSMTDWDWQGKMDNAKYYNYIRTQKQIVSDMNGGHPSVGSPVGSPVSYWKMDEGYSTTAHDSEIAGNDLTLSSASWTNSGKFGKAWNGTGSVWLSRADDADFDFAATDNLSISLWFKSDSATNPTSGADQYLFTKGTITNTGTAGYAIYADSNGKINFGIKDDGAWGASSPGTPAPDDTVTSTSDIYDGTWHHIVATKTGTSRIDLYVDGRLDASDTSLAATATLANAISLFVGDDNGNATNAFAGDIDEVKIYRYALTANEVKIDMNNNSSQVLGALSDNTSYQKQAANQEYCIPGDTTSCAAPVGRWMFDEKSGTNAYDSSGNNNTGTLTGGPTWTPGKVGAALKFDGIDDYVNAGSAASLDDQQPFTISAWINPVLTTVGYLVAKRDGANTGYFAFSYQSSNNSISFLKDTDNVTLDVGSAANTISSGWSHVVLTWDGSLTGTNVHMYINGTETTYDHQTSGTGNLLSDAASNFLIGSRGGTSQFFQGSIDDVRFYNYVRTPAQVAWEYNRGGPVAWYKMDECQGTTINDSSGKGNTGTLSIGGTGTQTTVGTCTTPTNGTGAWYNGATGKYNSSLSFDGTDDRVTIPDSSSFDFGTANFSVAAWIKASTSQLSFPTVMAQRTTAGWALFLDSNGKPSIITPGNTSTNNGTQDLRDNTWHHLVMVRTSSNLQIYTDGKLIFQSAAADNSAISETTSVEIGHDAANSGSTWFNGQIDDTRVYKYALTATQIKALYNQGSAIRFGPATGAP